MNTLNMQKNKIKTHGDWILQRGWITGRLNNNRIKNKQKEQLTRLTGKGRTPGNINAGQQNLRKQNHTQESVERYTEYQE